MITKSILLLDDDDDDCCLFQDALHEIDGTTSLTTLNSCHQMMMALRKPKANLPDLIVMDLNMPKQNGFECLADLKVTEGLKHIPVVVMSTSTQREAIDMVRRRGAMHYIAKPYAYIAMKQIVARLLSINPQMINNLQPSENFMLEF